MPDLLTRELGLVDYTPTLQAMRAFTDSRVIFEKRPIGT